jgi:hypothetical protein
VACGLAPLIAGIVLDTLIARTGEPLAVYRGYFLVAAALQSLSFLPLRVFKSG